MIFQLLKFIIETLMRQDIQSYSNSTLLVMSLFIIMISVKISTISMKIFQASEKHQYYIRDQSEIKRSRLNKTIVILFMIPLYLTLELMYNTSYQLNVDHGVKVYDSSRYSFEIVESEYQLSDLIKLEKFSVLITDSQREDDIRVDNVFVSKVHEIRSVKNDGSVSIDNQQLKIREISDVSRFYSKVEKTNAVYQLSSDIKVDVDTDMNPDLLKIMSSLYSHVD